MAEQQAAAPSIQVVTQYVKDVSFENPHAPESLVAGWQPPETGVQVSLSQKMVKDGMFETAIRMRVEAKNKADGRMAFIIDLHYGALVVLANVPSDAQQAVLMVEVPKLLFPFARQIISDLTAQGGYPPLYLAPVNFEGIYMNEMKRMQAQSKSGTA